MKAAKPKITILEGARFTTGEDVYDSATLAGTLVQPRLSRSIGSPVIFLGSDVAMKS
jgi:hypothetical protein